MPIDEQQQPSAKLVLAGHMKKAIFRIEELAPQTGLALIVLDARAPGASDCPVIEKVLRGAPIIRVLGKADLAPPSAVKAWLRAFRSDGRAAVAFTKNRPGRVDDFLAAAEAASGSRLRGKKITRILVAGTPNTGKSTLINFLLGRRAANVGAKPGITKSVQLLNIAGGLYIFDTPGILPPRCETDAERHMLALIGSLQQSEYDIEETGAFLYHKLLESAPGEVAKYLADPAAPAPEFLAFREHAAAARGLLLKGGAPDVARFTRALIDDFSNGKFGKIALERPAPRGAAALD